MREQPRVQRDGPASADPESFEHPRGTLVIVLVFGLLFALGWLGMYFWMYLGRGVLHA
jgi:hypothetical protein